jgi:hypothetical protein
MNGLQVLDIARRFMYVYLSAPGFREISISEAYGDTACTTGVHDFDLLVLMGWQALFTLPLLRPLFLTYCLRSTWLY